MKTLCLAVVITSVWLRIMFIPDSFEFAPNKVCNSYTFSVVPLLYHFHHFFFK